MSAVRLRTAQTEEIAPERLDEITALCEAAFGESFAGAWERVGPGLHVVAELAGRAVAHAMIVDRKLYLGHEMDLALDVGYVEHVATLPSAQGAGHGATVMRDVARIIRDGYQLGALATGSNAFYQRLGWETWAGPTFVRTADGELLRSAAEDGHVMVLRTPRTPAGTPLDVPIAVDWRADQPW